MDEDLKKVNRLRNCAESAKTSTIFIRHIPPTPMEETKEWYEELDSLDGVFCLACFENDRLLGYARFTGDRPPRPHVTVEEMIVDVNQKPRETAHTLVAAIKDFRNRYGYREAYFSLPQTSATIIEALKNQGFKNTGAVKGYFFTDGYYVDETFYEYP
jgi:RimJ/RimL family protein N-acetyltransferase